MLRRPQTFLRASAAALLVVAAALASLPAAVSSAAHQPRPRLRLIGHFDTPTAIVGVPGDESRLVVVERAGRIRMVHNGKKLPTPFLDIHTRVKGDGERGLLSIAFAPDYARSGLFYIYHTALDGTLTIEEYHRAANPDRALASSRRVVLTIPHPDHNHNSGELQFGPDGYLYLGTGDGGNHGDPHSNAENLDVMLGKILRIDPRATASAAYSVPPGNPFVGRTGVPPEIYAYGFRNPWKFTFDSVTGDLAIGDVGQDEVEEIDFRRNGSAAGANFGWNTCEATQAFPPKGNPRKRCTLKNTVRPSISLEHSEGYCAVIGGFVVRDRTLPTLYGRYLYGDLCKSGIRSTMLIPGAALDNRPAGLSVRDLTTFGQDSQGHLYAGSLDGGVWRIVNG
jgi:glucose/arabinose dehydrogenase